MKLLLDEMYDPAIAKELRRKYNYDVVAVQERADLVSMPDAELFEAAQEEGRTVVTENVADYQLLDAYYRGGERTHSGLLFTSNRSFPRSRPGTTGRLITALADYIAKRPEQPASIDWLQPIDDEDKGTSD